MIEYTYARDGKTCLCCFHPKEVVVGVCALCLNERLLVLASKQEKINKLKNTTNEYYRSFLMSKKKNNIDGHDHHHQGGLDEHNNNNNHHHQYPRIHLPKMFALSSLLSRLDISHGRKVEEVHDIADDDDASSCSHEESFISIKFENNGVGSWEKGVTNVVPKVSDLKHCDMSWSRTSSKDGNGGAKVAVIEHVKPRLPLRWRKRIGHIFQVIKLKRSTKGSSSSSVCHVGTKLEGVKVRHGHGHGWIRTLTKRKTKD